MSLSKRKRNSNLITFFYLITFLIIFSACLNDSPRRIPPKAVKGVLDLVDWDFSKDGPVNLSGEWEFYWQQHLIPQDFITRVPYFKTEFIEVPRYWTGYQLGEKKLPGYGYATYRLNILLNKQKAPLSLRAVDISNAYRMYVNGQMVNALGQAGKDRETTAPQEVLQIIDIDLASDTKKMELIFQVSNFHHRRGGIWEIIRLGKEKDIRRAWEKMLSFDLFLIGSILLMALYHLGLFIFRKKDRSPFYYSIFCFLTGLRSVTAGNGYLNFIFPEISWELMVKLEYLSYYMAVPAFAMFMHSLFPKFSKRILVILKGLGVCF